MKDHVSLSPLVILPPQMGISPNKIVVFCGDYHLFIETWQKKGRSPLLSRPLFKDP